MRFALACLITILVLPASASAQSAAIGSSLVTFAFSRPEWLEVDRIQVFSTPFEAAWERGPLALDIRGAYARGIATSSRGGSSEISGPVDTRVRLGLSVRGLTVTGVALLPTGDARYSGNDLPLLGVIAAELLPLPVQAWGTGGAFGGEARYATSVGVVSLGLSAGYLAQGGYQPLDATPVYRPGNQARVRAAVDVHLGVASVLSLLVGHQRFAGDVYGEVNLFHSGPRSEAVVVFAHPIGARESVSVYGGVYARSPGVVTAAPARRPDLPLGIVDSSARRLWLFGAELRASRGRLTGMPSLELRSLRTGDGLGEGWLASVGLVLDYHVAGGRFGSRLIASPHVNAHLGSFALPEGSASSVRGLDAGLTLRWRT